MAEPTTSNFPSSIDNSTSLGGDVVNLTQLTLDTGITAASSTISVSETITNINTPCYLLIGNELIWAEGKSGGDFINCVRGAGGTSAASASSGAIVYLTYGANLFNQLKRAIIAAQTALGIASASAIQTGKLDFPTSTELTIATGSITPTQNWHTVDTEADAASDDLDTIATTNATDGFLLVIRPNNTARTVVVKHDTGNINTTTAADITLDETYKFCILIYDATLTKWLAFALSSGSSSDKYPCEARLTLSTGVPVPTSELTAQGTLYLTKYNGDQVAVYTGSAWTTLTLGSDLSITLSGLATASKLYDIFAYSNSGTLAIESLVWTSDTARATALTTQNGVYVKSGDATRRYIGTIYIDSSKQCYQSKLHNYVFNINNPVDFFLQKDVDTSHSYASSTYRYYNNDSTQYVDYVVGIDNFVIMASISGQWSNVAAGEAGYAAIGLDNTTALSPVASFSFDGRDVVPIFINRGVSGVGLHKLNMLEAAVGTVTMGNYTLSAVVKG